MDFNYFRIFNKLGYYYYEIIIYTLKNNHNN